MPRGDGTGPLGRGPMTGRGLGRGGGRGGGMGRGVGAGTGRGRGLGRGTGAGVGRGAGVNSGTHRNVAVVGTCVCPQCGATAPRRWGVPCSESLCPNCGVAMVKKN